MHRLGRRASLSGFCFKNIKAQRGERTPKHRSSKGESGTSFQLQETSPLDWRGGREWSKGFHPASSSAKALRAERSACRECPGLSLTLAGMRGNGPHTVLFPVCLNSFLKNKLTSFKA